MELFKEGQKLFTITKVGSIEHKTSEIVKEEAKNFTFKKAYDEFVEQFYSKGNVVLGENKRAYILVKRDVFSAKTEKFHNGLYAKIKDWKKIGNLKSEFKAITRANKIIAEFKFEEKKAV